MKAEVEAEALAPAVKAAASVARGRDALSCLLISATPDGLSITGGDGDTFVTHAAGGDVEREGKVCAPARTLAKAVGNLTGVVELSEDDDGAFGLETKTSRLTLPTVKASEYPAFSMSEGEPVEMAPFWENLSRISYAADNPRSTHPRHYSLAFYPDGHVEAYGGTRVATCPSPEGFDGLVLRSSIDAAVNLLGDEEISMWVAPNFVRFSAGPTDIVCRTPQGERPALPLQLDQPHQISFERKEMLEALALVEVVKGDIAVPIRIDVVRGELRMRASSPDVGEVAVALEIEGDIPFPSGLTSSHTRDALVNCLGQRVTLEFGPSANKPLRIIDGEVTHIINPNMSAVKNNPAPEGE